MFSWQHSEAVGRLGRDSGTWKDNGWEKSFREAYAAQRSQWPDRTTDQDIATSFGKTHVLSCGSQPDGEGAMPVVLLHGHGCTATVWSRNAEAWSKNRRLYAIDEIRDAGLSIPDGQIIADADGYVRWVLELLEALQLSRVVLIGHSYGSWLAFQVAAAVPERVAGLVLLDPTDVLLGMRLGYKLRAVPVLARPSASAHRRLLDWETSGAELDSSFLDLTTAIAAGFTGPSVVLPHAAKDDVLAQWRVPTLVVLAEQSKVHDLRRLATKVESVPNMNVAWVPGSHHTLPRQPAQRLNTQVEQFLRQLH